MSSPSRIDPSRFILADAHPESLLRLSLVQQMLDDPVVRLVPRCVDRRWFYEKQVPVALTGFNSAAAQVYYGAVSAFADWLKQPGGSARPFNEADFLVPEVLFAVHDYLHAWAYQVINDIKPDFEFGFGEITRSTAEAFAFGHLATEAVATAGLDYWYLSQFDLGSAIPIGTAMQHLTVDYSERHIGEYRRFSPTFRVDDPAFVVELGEFYCTGVLRGFAAQDLRDSPLLLRWLEHEISYGSKQREYTRMWLQHLAADDLGYGGTSLDAPVAFHPWMKEMLGELSRRLWRKVVEDERGPTPRTIPPEACWASRRPAREFRFTNISTLTAAEVAEANRATLSETSFNYWFWQFLSQHDLSTVPPEAIRLLPLSRSERDMRAVRWLLRDAKKLPPDDCPRSIFMIN